MFTSMLDLSGNDSGKIKKCSRCGGPIVWVKSKKGKNYPVNFCGLTDVETRDFHKCGEPSIVSGQVEK